MYPSLLQLRSTESPSRKACKSSQHSTWDLCSPDKCLLSNPQSIGAMELANQLIDYTRDMIEASFLDLVNSSPAQSHQGCDLTQVALQAVQGSA